MGEKRGGVRVEEATHGVVWKLSTQPHVDHAWVR